MPPTVEFTEVKSAAELNTQNPPPFVASQSGVAPTPTANEEAQLRELFQQAAASGNDDLNTTVTIPQPAAPVGLEQPPVSAPIAPPASPTVPAKFLTPQGTVDEDKLKASSKQLDEAIANKEKTIGEILASYKDREKKLHEVSQTAATLAKTPSVPSPVMPPPLSAADPQMAQLHQQILADMQRDPVGTTIMLNQAMVNQQLAPILDRFRQEEEVRRDQSVRENVARLAEADPRILQHFVVVNQILDEDPGMMKLKNPHKAAWNEAKERLRLGEVGQPPAQPSSSAPTLGRGAPPSVSTLPAPASPNQMFQQAQQLNPYSDEGKRYEEQLREATRNLWQ